MRRALLWGYVLVMFAPLAVELVRLATSTQARRRRET